MIPSIADKIKEIPAAPKIPRKPKEIKGNKNTSRELNTILCPNRNFPSRIAIKKIPVIVLIEIAIKNKIYSNPIGDCKKCKEGDQKSILKINIVPKIAEIKVVTTIEVMKTELRSNLLKYFIDELSNPPLDNTINSILDEINTVAIPTVSAG